MRNRQIVFILIPFFIFIVSLGIRIIYAYNSTVKLSGDALVYEGLALSIKDQGVFSLTMLKNFPLKDHPIYPIFLGVIYSLFGVNHFPVFIIQSFIGSLLCVLIYLIAMEFFNIKVAILSGVIAAFYPIFIKLPNMLLTENLFIFLFLLSIWMVIKYMNSLRLHYLILAALSLGLSVLTRSVVLLFIFMLLLYLFFFQKKKIKMKRNILNLFVFFSVFICSIAPWSIRNFYVSGGSIIPVTDRAEWGIYASFCPYKGKIFGIRPDDDPVMVQARNISSLSERRKFLLSKTIQFIRENPIKVLKLEILKILYLWSPFSWEILGGGQAIYNFGFVFVMPFFIWGVISLMKEEKSKYLFLLLPVIYFQLFHMIYFALPRFRIGFEPFLIVIAAYAIFSIYSRVLQKRLYVLTLMMFLAANFVLFLYSSETKIILRKMCQMIGLW